MAKANNPQQDSEMTASFTDVIVDVVSEGQAISEAPKVPRVAIDGVEYDATSLSAAAKGAIASLRFAEAKLMELHNELAICQTSHFAYIKGLMGELEGKAS